MMRLKAMQCTCRRAGQGALAGTGKGVLSVVRLQTRWLRVVAVVVTSKARKGCFREGVVLVEEEVEEEDGALAGQGWLLETCPLASKHGTTVPPCRHRGRVDKLQRPTSGNKVEEESHRRLYRLVELLAAALGRSVGAACTSRSTATHLACTTSPRPSRLL